MKFQHVWSFPLVRPEARFLVGSAGRNLMYVKFPKSALHSYVYEDVFFPRVLEAVLYLGHKIKFMPIAAHVDV